MTMTMFYIHGIGEKKDAHVNFPAATARDAYDAFKSEMGEKCTVTEIVALFQFEYAEPQRVVGVN